MLLTVLLPLFFMISTSMCAICSPSFQLVLDPAGDHRNAGRCIVDCFERGIALQWAHRLKQEIEKKTSDIKVTITRRPAEITQAFHAAQVANKIRADLFITLQAYYEPMAPAIVSLYTYTQNSLPPSTHDTLRLCPIEQAHTVARVSSLTYVNDLANYINGCEPLRGICIARQPLSLPLKQLAGITQPAFVLELGCSNPTQWNLLIDPLVTWIVQTTQSKTAP